MHNFMSLTILMFMLVFNVKGSNENKQTTKIRLVGGNSDATGRLEILVNSTWTSVYGYRRFDDNATKVACKMLGFQNSGIAYTFSNGEGIQIFGEGKGEVVEKYFRCNGNETDLKECVSGFWYPRSDSHSYDVCISCEPTKIRLADGDSSSSGRVEVFIKGAWTPICDSNFDTNDAKAVCNMLGFGKTGIVKVFGNSPYGTAVGKAALRNLDCQGTESDIKQCSGTWGYSTCDHSYDANLACGSTPIRLANGPNNSSGRVEVQHGGEWGTICGYSSFNQQDVLVICRMLGFNNPHAIGYESPFYGEGLGAVVIDRLNCDGTEDDIANCQSSQWNSKYSPTKTCQHDYDVGVNCKGETVIRLVDGPTEKTGRLEILHNGFWGTVSDTGFDNHDLRVVCKMLGYQYSFKSFFMVDSYYGEGIGEVIASNLQCSGAENDIGRCKATWWPNTGTVDHDNDVGVSCDGVVPVRVVDGSSNTSGRVEVLHNKFYGTVCSRGFDRLDLIVICRLLGIPHASRSAYWYPAAADYQGIGEMVVSDLKCNGIEKNLGQCQGTWPASSYCDHGQDVYVNCDGSGEKLRLVGGPDSYSGRVEIFHGGEWGTICDTGFDRADAVVICRILNFKHPERAIAYTRAHFGQANDTLPVVMGSLNCNGIESTLGQCNPTWNMGSQCNHYQDAGVDCCSACQTAIVG